ncbi:MAG: IS630 family transposase, partial [Halomonas sp.]|nr:IS630 family transposase [Halomonas sp.]
MARRFISPLTEADRQTLAHVHEYGQKRASRRRAHAILLSDQ